MADNKIIQKINGSDIISKSYDIINKNFNILLNKLKNLENAAIIQPDGSSFNDISEFKWVDGKYIIKLNNGKEIVSTSNIPLSTDKINGLVSTDKQVISGEKYFNDGIVLNDNSCIKGTNGSNIITQKDGIIFIGGDSDGKGGIALRYDENGNFIDLNYLASNSYNPVNQTDSADITSIISRISNLENRIENIKNRIENMENGTTSADAASILSEIKEVKIEIGELRTDIKTMNTSITKSIENLKLSSSSSVGYDDSITEQNVPVSVISINSGNDELHYNQTGTSKIPYEVLPNNATYEKLTFYSSNLNVATVDDKGNINILANGSTIIKITSDNGMYDECTIIVDIKEEDNSNVNIDGLDPDDYTEVEDEEIENSKPAASVEITDTDGGSISDFTLVVGEKISLGTKTIPSNSTEIYSDMTSSDESVVIVENGVVKAVGEGTVTLTATATNKSSSIPSLFSSRMMTMALNDDDEEEELSLYSEEEETTSLLNGMKLNQIKVNVLPETYENQYFVDVDNVTIDWYPKKDYYKDGDLVRLKAVVSPANATFQNVEWITDTPDNYSKANIDEQGLMYISHGHGFNVTAKVGNKTCEQYFSREYSSKEEPGLNVNFESVEFKFGCYFSKLVTPGTNIKIFDDLYLEVKTWPDYTKWSNGKTFALNKLEFVSSNPRVVTVSRTNVYYDSVNDYYKNFDWAKKTIYQYGSSVSLQVNQVYTDTDVDITVYCKDNPEIRDTFTLTVSRNRKCDIQYVSTSIGRNDKNKLLDKNFIFKGDKIQFFAGYNYITDGSEADIKFESSNPNILRVTNYRFTNYFDKGTEDCPCVDLVAVGEGDVLITASVPSMPYKKRINKFTVVDKINLIDKISIKKEVDERIMEVRVGDKINLTGVIEPVDATYARTKWICDRIEMLDSRVENNDWEIVDAQNDETNCGIIKLLHSNGKHATYEALAEGYAKVKFRVYVVDNNYPSSGYHTTSFTNESTTEYYKEMGNNYYGSIYDYNPEYVENAFQRQCIIKVLPSLVDNNIDESKYPDTQKIYYKSTNGEIVSPGTPKYICKKYGYKTVTANLLYNTYNKEEDKGCMIFDGDIVSIGYYAFRDSYNLKEITLPDSLETVERSAFEGCDKLESFIIPDNVTSFEGLSSTSLKRIFVGKNVSKLSFSGVNLEEIKVKEGNETYTSRDADGNERNCIIEIKENKIINACKNTKIIPDGITSIEGFGGITFDDGTHIRIPNSVTYINSFSRTNIKSVGTSDDDTIILPNDNDVPDDYTLYINSISYCNELESVVLPKYVEKIPTFAYSTVKSIHCKNEDIIPSQSYCFAHCVNLTTLGIGNKYKENRIYLSKKDAYGMFEGCNSINLIGPDGIENVPDNYVYVIIPNSYNGISGQMFSKCENLRTIVIPRTIEQTGYGQLPSTSGRASVFDNCGMLKYIYIPKELESLSVWEFSRCYYIDKVYYEGTKDEFDKINKNSFSIDFEKYPDKLKTLYDYDSNYLNPLMPS